MVQRNQKPKEEQLVPRYGQVPKMDIPPDPVYGSVLLNKFINKLMLDGKKSVAEKILYTALELIKEKTKRDPMEVFDKALANAVPLLDVKARRVGGATYQVPVEVPRIRGQALAMQWIREAARSRGGKSMIENLAAELMDASNNVGGAIKMREDKYKTAEANKAFSHFRW
jgi:small subunit ribosomal protein S7